MVFKIHPINLTHIQRYVGPDRMHRILSDVEKQLMDIYNPWYLGWEGEYDSQRNRGTWVAEWRDPTSEVTEARILLLLACIIGGEASTGRPALTVSR